MSDSCCWTDGTPVCASTKTRAIARSNSVARFARRRISNLQMVDLINGVADAESALCLRYGDCQRIFAVRLFPDDGRDLIFTGGDVVLRGDTKLLVVFRHDYRESRRLLEDGVDRGHNPSSEENVDITSTMEEGSGIR